MVCGLWIHWDVLGLDIAQPGLHTNANLDHKLNEIRFIPQSPLPDVVGETVSKCQQSNL